MRMNLAAAIERSLGESVLRAKNSLFKSFMAHEILPLGGLRRLAGGIPVPRLPFAPSVKFSSVLSFFLKTVVFLSSSTIADFRIKFITDRLMRQLLDPVNEKRSIAAEREDESDPPPVDCTLLVGTIVESTLPKSLLDIPYQ